MSSVRTRKRAQLPLPHAVERRSFGIAGWRWLHSASPLYILDSIRPLKQRPGTLWPGFGVYFPSIKDLKILVGGPMRCSSIIPVFLALVSLTCRSSLDDSSSPDDSQADDSQADDSSSPDDSQADDSGGCPFAAGLSPAAITLQSTSSGVDIFVTGCYPVLVVSCPAWVVLSNVPSSVYGTDHFTIAPAPNWAVPLSGSCDVSGLTLAVDIY